MLKTTAIVIAAVLAVLVVSVLVVAATKPDNFRVQRSALIDAPPEAIFPLINDFRQWPKWSPYEKLDPDMKRTYSGPAEGEGAVYEWNGDSNVGQGRTAITSTSRLSAITMTLDMIRPMECHNVVNFLLEPQGDSTRVTWAMEGAASYPSKILQVFVSMDSMVGSQFEEGLANLKTAAEEKEASERH